MTKINRVKYAVTQTCGMVETVLSVHRSVDAAYAAKAKKEKECAAFTFWVIEGTDLVKGMELAA